MLTYTTISRGAGVTSRYTTQPDTDTLATLLAFKPSTKRPRIRAERRAYPSGKRTWCTAEYVREYFRLNTMRDGIRLVGPKIHAYDDIIDHVAGFQPLSRALQYWPEGDGVEEAIA